MSKAGKDVPGRRERNAKSRARYKIIGHTKLVIRIQDIHERVAENIATERERDKIRKAFVCNANEFELYHEGVTPKNSCWMDE